VTAEPARFAVTVMTHHGATNKSNEDAFAVGALTACGVDMLDPVTCVLSGGQPQLVAVADGLGGHAAGEEAAAHAVRLLAASPAVTTGEQLTELLDRVNQEVYALGATRPEFQGAGTTIAGLVLANDRVMWFNVGDSRVYREDGGYLGQLSVDDSLGGLASQGDDGAVVARSSIVTQSLGGAEVVTPIAAHIGVEPAESADTDGRAARWLVCSDGLTDMVPVADIEKILAAEPADARAAKALWATAMNAGGRDNISVILVRREGVSDA
jgi:PPM family protein phosphatase